MKSLIGWGAKPVDSHVNEKTDQQWSLFRKLMLGLTPGQYLGVVTHSSNDYPWGLFLGFGLFAMVPLSASGFMLGTAVEIFGRHDFEPIERLALLNGLLGYLFAVIYLMVDLGQPWRLPYPMVVSFGPAAVLFLVAWHVATYLSVQVAEVSVSFFEWIGWLGGKRFIRRIAIGLTVAASSDA
jgi:Ni/Fe-hydrogenase subunit HybB-like protein